MGGLVDPEDVHLNDESNRGITETVANIYKGMHPGDAAYVVHPECLQDTSTEGLYGSEGCDMAEGPSSGDD